MPRKNTPLAQPIHCPPIILSSWELNRPKEYQNHKLHADDSEVEIDQKYWYPVIPKSASDDCEVIKPSQANSPDSQKLELFQAFDKSGIIENRSPFISPIAKQNYPVEEEGIFWKKQDIMMAEGLRLHGVEIFTWYLIWALLTVLFFESVAFECYVHVCKFYFMGVMKECFEI